VYKQDRQGEKEREKSDRKRGKEQDYNRERQEID
jgi:hypothetical protein